MNITKGKKIWGKKAHVGKSRAVQTLSQGKISNLLQERSKSYKSLKYLNSVFLFFKNHSKLV